MPQLTSAHQERGIQRKPTIRQHRPNLPQFGYSEGDDYLWRPPSPRLLSSFHTPTQEETQVSNDKLGKLQNVGRFFVDNAHRATDLRGEPVDVTSVAMPRCKDLIGLHHCVLSPVRKLPDEILAEIFMGCVRNDPQAIEAYPSAFAAEEYGPLSQRMRLMSVCQRWRYILVNTPDIWSSISISFREITRHSSTSPEALKYIQRVVAYSGKQDLRVELGGSKLAYLTRGQHQRPSKVRDLRHFGHALESSFKRWDHLSLTRMEALFLSHIGILPKSLPNLRSMFLKVTREDQDATNEEIIKTLPVTPSLAELEVWGGSPAFLNEWLGLQPRLTHLFLARSYSDTSNFLPSLRPLRNLVHLRLHVPGGLDICNDNHTDRWVAVNLPNLETLWLDSRSTVFGHIFQTFTCPNLDTLILRQKVFAGAEDAKWIFVDRCVGDFIRRSGCRITRLCVIDLYPNHFSLILPRFNDVKELEVAVTQVYLNDAPSMDIINTFFYHLVLHPDDAKVVAEDPPILPRLKKFSFSYGGRNGRRQFDVNNLVSMCQSRLFDRGKGRWITGQRVRSLGELRLTVTDRAHLQEEEVVQIKSLRDVAKKIGADIRIMVNRGENSAYWWEVNGDGSMREPRNFNW